MACPTAIPTVPPIVLTYIVRGGGVHCGYEISAPEEAKSARRRGHIFDRHGRLQSNEGHLEGNQQPWPHGEECSTWNRQPTPSAVTSG